VITETLVVCLHSLNIRSKGEREECFQFDSADELEKCGILYGQYKSFRICRSIWIPCFSSTYGSLRRLHYTIRHSDGQYKVNNFNPLGDILRCFDPVWRLNLIAINLKNMHTPEQIDSDSLRKTVYTRVFSADSLETLRF
jgi:hypothetical protein